MLETGLIGAKKETGGSIKDTDAASFEVDVIAASMKNPVIVDFWAPWCGPCKQMMPTLEKAVGDSKGAVSLVKVNIDNNPDLAQAFRVQSVPMVYAFFQGQPVDGFMGAKSPSEIAAFIDKLKKLGGANQNAPVELSREENAKLMADGTRYLSEEKYTEAMAAFSMVLDVDHENMEALASIGWCFVGMKDKESLAALLEEAPKAHPRIKGLQILLASGAQAQETKITEAKTSAEKYELALQKLAVLDIAGAIDALVELTKKDREWQEQKARKLLLDLFEAMGPAHPLARDGRRKLSAVLFS